MTGSTPGSCLEKAFPPVLAATVLPDHRHSHSHPQESCHRNAPSGGIGERTFASAFLDTGGPIIPKREREKEVTEKNLSNRLVDTMCYSIIPTGV